MIKRVDGKHKSVTQLSKLKVHAPLGWIRTILGVVRTALDRSGSAKCKWVTVQDKGGEIQLAGPFTSERLRFHDG